MAVKFVDGRMDFEEAMHLVRDPVLRGVCFGLVSLLPPPTLALLHATPRCSRRARSCTFFICLSNLCSKNAPPLLPTGFLPKDIVLDDPECRKSSSRVHSDRDLDTSSDDDKDSDLDRPLIASPSIASAEDRRVGPEGGEVGAKRRAEEVGGQEEGDAQGAGGGGGGGRGVAGTNSENSAETKTCESSKSCTSSDGDDELDPDLQVLDAAGRARVLAKGGGGHGGESSEE